MAPCGRDSSNTGDARVGGTNNRKPVEAESSFRNKPSTNNAYLEIAAERMFPLFIWTDFRKKNILCNIVTWVWIKILGSDPRSFLNNIHWAPRNERAVNYIHSEDSHESAITYKIDQTDI